MLINFYFFFQFLTRRFWHKNIIMKKKLLVHLQHDKDFYPYFSVLEEVVESIDLENYFLDKKYLDISYVVIEDKIINLDEIYFLCKSFSAE